MASAVCLVVFCLVSVDGMAVDVWVNDSITWDAQQGCRAYRHIKPARPPDTACRSTGYDRARNGFRRWHDLAAA